MLDIKEWLKEAMYNADVAWIQNKFSYSESEMEKQLNYLNKNSYTDSDLYYFLQDSTTVYESNPRHSRHWDEIDVVVKVEDKYVHFTKATTTTDYSARECGWEFDWDDCYFVEPVEVITIRYNRIKK